MGRFRCSTRLLCTYPSSQSKEKSRWYHCLLKSLRIVQSACQDLPFTGTYSTKLQREQAASDHRKSSNSIPQQYVQYLHGTILHLNENESFNSYTVTFLISLGKIHSSTMHGCMLLEDTLISIHSVIKFRSIFSTHLSIFQRYTQHDKASVSPNFSISFSPHQFLEAIFATPSD